VTTATFSYTGSVQTWVCPAGVTTVTIEGWGAEGGSPSLGTATPGKGGYEIISIATAEDIGWIDVWTEFTPYSTTTGHYAWSWPASATAVTSGTVDGVGRLGKTFNTGTYAWVGSERDLAQYLNGDIAELIRYNRALTIDEVNLVGQYLAAKYAIAWAGL